jgi:Xaa-Pro aminopeptidase
MKTRINNLRKILRQNNLSAFFVTSEINRKYLSGFSGSKGDLLVTNKKTFLFTDSRYGERAKEEIKGNIEVIVVDKDYLKTIKEFLKRVNVSKIGIEADDMSVQFYDNLKKNLRGIKLVKTENLIKGIRVIKDEEEIKKLKKAVDLTDETFSFIFKFIKNNYKKGLTEKRISWEMEKFIRENKGADLSFESIVASGKNSAIPHHLSGLRKIKKGDMVLLDFGAMFRGYHADMSRTIFISKPNKKQEEIYSKVLRAQKEIIKMIRPGILSGDLDNNAREIFEKFGCRENFLHGLGHGVGLEIHEFPSMHQTRAGNDIKLKPNMIFTVEPGIYYSGFGGVRIEDIVLVTEYGRKVLSKSPKDLAEMVC